MLQRALNVSAFRFPDQGRATRTLRRAGRSTALTALACTTAAMAGCSAYTLHGRVVRGTEASVMIVPADDPRLTEGEGVADATITVTQDPFTLNRREVGRATSAEDGTFALTVSAMGVGFLDEDWLVSASRRGHASIDTPIRLPMNPGTTRMLVRMAPGAGGPAPAGTSRDAVSEEIRRFMR